MEIQDLLKDQELITALLEQGPAVHEITKANDRDTLVVYGWELASVKPEGIWDQSARVFLGVSGALHAVLFQDNIYRGAFSAPTPEAMFKEMLQYSEPEEAERRILNGLWRVAWRKATERLPIIATSRRDVLL